MAGVFISYSRKDVEAARTIDEALYSKNIKCWRDERWLSAGADFIEEITRAIRQCDLFVLLVSVNSTASEAVAIEVSLANHFHRRIIPILLDRSDIPDKILPYTVRLQYLDVSSGPLYGHLPTIVQPKGPAACIAD
jgi:hypothetical protein